MAFITAQDGLRIAYETVGDGAPLILLHGGGQSRRTWFDYDYVEPLAALGRQVILIDARAR